MMNTVSKIVNTINREGFNAVIRKTNNRYSSWKQIRKIDFQKAENHWKSLKNRYQGERVFLIGNGPSLNKTPLYLLKNEYKMCFNRFHIMTERLNWEPDFFMTSDNLVLSDLIKEFDQLIPKTKLSFFPGIHFRGDNYIKEVEKYDNAYWTVQLHGRGFSEDLPKIFPGGSVIYEGFQVLKYLGFNKVYLIGVDMNYQVHKTAKRLEKKGIDIISQNDDDPNHFDPRYFGKDRKYHQPEKYVINNTIKDLKYLAGHFVSDAFQIINIGFDSKLSVFERDDFWRILNMSADKQKNIFYNLLLDVAKSQNESLSFGKFPVIERENLKQDINYSFILDNTEDLSIIKSFIFTHIPIGPYNNKYFFIKRKKL